MICFTILTFLVFSSILLAEQSVAPSQDLYTLPMSVDFSIRQTEANASDPYQLVFEAKIEAKLGELKNVQVDFECTPDLSVEPRKETIPTLASGTSKVWKLQVKRGLKRIGTDGSFLRMFFTYLPDYDQQMKAVRNETLYPQKSQREELLALISQNKKERVKEGYSPQVEFYDSLKPLTESERNGKHETIQTPAVKALPLIKKYLDKSKYADFLRKFFSDKAFQLSHIRFPLMTTAEDETGKTEQIVLATDVAGEPLDIDYNAGVGLEIVENNDHSFTMTVFGEQSGISVSYVFKPENGSFFLVSVADQSM